VLAVITSEWFFDEVVRHGFTVDPATFRPVRVAVKETTTVGWISLPDHPYAPDIAQLRAVPLAEPVGPVPHQLPAAPGSFTGRADELATLTAAVDTTARSGTTLVISAIAGAGGMGKTWLALHWAHQHIDRFPDGQLFVDLRGFSPDSQPMSAEVAVRGFLDALGVEPGHIPVDQHAQTSLFRSLVADKRILILLDNAVDTAQVTALLPGSPTATVLVTSRNHLPGLLTAHGAHHLSVKVLTDTEAHALLTTRLGADRVATERTAADQLVTYCRGLPLALSIVAGRAHTHPNLPLATLAAELRGAGLDALGDDGDPTASLPTVLSWSYRALTNDQATMFGLLGIAPGPDISLPAATSLAGLPIARARAVLRGLEQASLLGQDTSGRYRMHDLIRRYAADYTHNDADDDWETALRRVVDFYLHTAVSGERLLDPTRPTIQLAPPVPGCLPHPLLDYSGAMAWFQTEHSCLLTAQHMAAARGWHLIVWQLAWSLFTYHSRRGCLRDGIAVWQAGLAAADNLDDDAIQAHSHHQLGRSYALAGHHGQALDHLQRALTLAEHLHHRSLQAHINRMLAVAAEQQGDDQQALQHATQALHLYQALDNPLREAEAHNGVGWYAARLGQHDQARAHCETALIVHRRHHHRDGEAATLRILGYIAHHTGQHLRAIDYYQQALAVRRDQSNTYQEANVLDGIGYPHLALGQREQARAAWQQALQLYQIQYRVADAHRIQQQLNTLDTSIVEPNGLPPQEYLRRTVP
jgi:tetratricopeptide (TPR) repeat protein